MIFPDFLHFVDLPLFFFRQEAEELPDKELSRKHCWEFLLVSCGSGFLNGLLGLPGPP
jgi:uncharacterized membrane protein YfcA